ncbi:MAG: FAD-dependent oxidoreductase [Thermoplasmatota archaeon]
MTQNIKICIIGAGIGGLTAGALYTKKGYDVTIYEKEPLIGGRALSFDASSVTMSEYLNILSRYNIDIPFSYPSLDTIFSQSMLKGYYLDLGYHAIGGGVLSNINTLLSEIDDRLDFIESRVGFIKENSYDFPFLSKVDMIKISPYVLRLLLSGEKTMRRLDPISMTKTIKKYGRGKMKLILEIFSRSITTVNNLERISTGEMFRSQKNLYKGSKPVGYPKQGLGAVHKKLLEYIKNNGGKIHVSTPVERILIEDGKAIGVLIKNRPVYYDVIVSNILVQNLFSLADESNFPPDYVSSIKSLTGTGSLCAYYSLSQLKPELIGKTFHFIERDIGVDGNDAVGMIDFMATSPQAGMAPPDAFLVQSYIICTPKEAKNKKIQVKLKELLDKNLELLIPDYSSHLCWAMYPVVYHLDGVAKTIDNKKPDIKTPVQNLFLIGDCVKAPGIGFNCALNSARMLVDTVTL